MKTIEAPTSQEWGSLLKGLEAALCLEKKVNQVGAHSFVCMDKNIFLFLLSSLCWICIRKQGNITIPTCPIS